MSVVGAVVILVAATFHGYGYIAGPFGHLTGGRPASMGYLGNAVHFLVFLGGLAMMALGSPFWPDAVLKVLMGPIIFAMGDSYGRATAFRSMWREEELAAQEESLMGFWRRQYMLTSVMWTIVLAVLTLLLIVLT